MASSASPVPRGSLARRERQKEETRARILEAARELFVVHGIEATTMRAIASRIEYTPTAIYHHFRDKDALIAELCATDFRALATALQRIGEIADPIERIRRMGLAYVEFALTNRSQYRFMFMTPSVHNHSMGEQIEKHNPEEDAYGFLRQTVEEGLRRGLFRAEFQDADQLAQLFWGGLHGLVSLHIAKADDDWITWRDPHATARLAVDTLLRGTRRAEPA
jgi:AcrR family transcriptional regulator